MSASAEVLKMISGLVKVTLATVPAVQQSFSLLVVHMLVIILGEFDILYSMFTCFLSYLPVRADGHPTSMHPRKQKMKNCLQFLV